MKTTIESILRNPVQKLFKELPDDCRQKLAEASSEKLVNIINTHALGSAAAALASGWVPGAGGTAALLASAGFIWAMYYRINTAIGVKLSKNLVKSLASAILTNIVTQMAGMIAMALAASAISFIPVIGSIAASVIMAGIAYAVVIAAGAVYLRLLTNLFKAGHEDLSEMTENEFKNAANTAVNEVDLQGVVSQARQVYKEGKDSGTITGKEAVDIAEFQ